MASNAVVEPVVDPVVCEYSKTSVQEPLREDTVIFDDGIIMLTDEKLVIRWYYFPFGFKKVIIPQHCCGLPNILAFVLTYFDFSNR